MKPSNVCRTYSIRTFIQALLFSLILSGIAVGFHWYTQPLATKPDMAKYWPLIAFVVFFYLLQWLVQKNTAMGLLDAGTAPEKSKPAAEPGLKEIAMDQEKRKQRDKRFFVHLFALLQREGRLIDFFQEDLDRYEDAQIGAAVRNIHESCNAAMKKYLKLLPVIEKNEGDDVIVDPGFNPNTIKLTGNVFGDPPFKGVLRHRGWKAAKSDLPVLSDTKDSTVIAPAEVEIE
jgi:hypothetical protein